MKRQGKERERFWRAHVGAWQRSGLTQREYCRRQGLTEWSFSDWKRRLARRSPAPVSFVPVALRDRLEACDCPAPRQHPLTVVVGDRYRVEVGEEFCGEALARLLAVLGRG
jgi:transposase